MEKAVKKCENPKCDNHFVPRSICHGFCSQQCRKQARGASWDLIREAALQRDEQECQDCHKTLCILHVHHLLPLCLGGSNALYNLLSLCVTCHQARHRNWRAYLIEEAA